MLKVNRKVEYGLIALKYIRTKPPGQLTTVREICERYGTPFDPVAHVLRVLNAAGVLRSEQGAHGGYRIAVNLEDLTFARLIELVQGQLAFTDCQKPGECTCSIRDRCNIVTPMDVVNRRLLAFLQTITVAELVQDDAAWNGVMERPPPPLRVAGSSL